MMEEVNQLLKHSVATTKRNSVKINRAKTVMAQHFRNEMNLLATRGQVTLLVDVMCQQKFCKPENKVFSRNQ